MHPKDLFASLIELLRELLRFEAPADGIVSATFRRHRSLGPRERHALAETAYAVLRRRLRYQHFAKEGVEAGTAAGQAQLLRRVAAQGWQGEEAVLRAALTPSELAWLQRVRSVDVSSLPAKLQHNLPDWIAQPLQRRLGDEGFAALARSLDVSAPLDLRVNALKARREEVHAALKQAGMASTSTPFSPWGLRVQGKPAIQRMPVFTGGQVEVQDEGSQLLALLTGAKRGEMVVDFCAGAGGKTLALGAMMRSTGRLYAFDTSGHRLEALKPRLARSGLSNVHPAQIAHERDERIKRLAGKIDRVLVDAPCSGLGTLRRNPDLKWRQSPAAIDELREKQAAILASAARLPKPGGRLVYATCSLLEAENEAIAEAFEAAHPEYERLPVAAVLQQAQVDAAESLADGLNLRLWPHRHETDGFFAAAWQRR